MQKQNKAKFRSFTKRLQCILSAVLMLLMTISTVPIETLIASAASEYNLYIDGEMVTSDNAKDILGNGIFSYDPNKNKLTINGDYTSKSNQSLIEYKSRNKELTIYVAGDSCLVKDFMTSAMYLTGNTTITGPGSLTIKSQNLAVLLRYATLNIFDANVYFVETDVDSVAYTFNGDNGILNVNNSNVEIVCCDRSSNSAIEGLSEMNLENCNITIPENGKYHDGRIIDSTGKTAQRVKIQKESYYCTIPNSRFLTLEEKVAVDDVEIIPGGELTFNAARNERESAQIVINKAGTYNNLSISMEDLRLETDPTSKDEDKIIFSSQIKYFFEQYVKVEKGYAKLNGLADDGISPVWYPDALINPTLAKELRLDSFTLNGQNKRNQGIWFTLSVPKNQKEGIYTGVFSITYNDAEKKVRALMFVCE